MKKSSAKRGKKVDSFDNPFDGEMVKGRVFTKKEMEKRMKYFEMFFSAMK